MRFDLKRPCEHCPFVNNDTRITFACRSRAEEIEEIAYREGFVCHKHAEYVENNDGEGQYEFGHDGNSQHCAGALYMYLQNGSGNVPWEWAIDENPELEERWWQRADLKALASVFESEEAFMDANTGPDE